MVSQTCTKKKHYKTIKSANQAKKTHLVTKGIELHVNLCSCGQYYLDSAMVNPVPVHVHKCKVQPKLTPKRIRRKLLTHCHRKMHYPTKNDANNARYKVSRKYGCRFKVYQCKSCGLWALSAIKDTSGQNMFNKIEIKEDDS